MSLIILGALLLSCLHRSAESLTTNATELCGTGHNFTYQSLSSKCYFLSSYTSANYSAAAEICSAAGSQLPQLESGADIGALQTHLHSIAVEADVWLGTTGIGSNLSSFKWTANSGEVDASLWIPNPSPSSNSFHCAVYHSDVYLTPTSHWSRIRGMMLENCNETRLVICQKLVTKCSTASLSNFNAGTMVAENVTAGLTYQNSLHIGLKQSIRCRPGFFRSRDSPTSTLPEPAVSADGLLANTAHCSYSSSAPAVYSVALKQGVIEECFPIRCKTSLILTEIRLPNVKPYDDKLSGLSHLNYSQSFNVTCATGYVNYRDSNSTLSDVSCGQNQIDKTLGEWQPPDLNTCTPVKCASISTITDTTKVKPYKAVNRIDEKSYNEFQSSRFPFFPNRVHLRCQTVGEFFDDRSFEKTVSCDLRNGSLIHGEWVGVLGTNVALLQSVQCIEVSCKSDELIAKTAEGQQQLNSLNFDPFATLILPNGTRTRVNASTVNEQELMPYRTVIAFSCQSGMDTGVGLPIVLCRNNGYWNVTQLPICTKTSDRIETRGKFFVPPAQEAEAAGSVGAFAVTLSVIFGLSIILLDVSTLSRDINVMKRNLMQLKLRFKGGNARENE